VGAAVTLAITAVFALRATKPALDRTLWRELARAALPLGLTLAVAELYFRADTIILSLSRPASDVGIYTLAYRVYELLALIPAVVMTTVFPLLSRQDGTTAERTLRATARAFWTLGVPIAAGGLVIAPELARLVGGEEFGASAGPLRLLLCAAALAYLSGLYGYALIAGGLQRLTLWLSVAALVTNVALNIALAPAYGPTAAAAIALGTEGLLFAGGWVLVRRRLNLRPAPEKPLAPVVSAAVMAAAVWPLRERTPVLTVPLGVLVYGLALWATGGIDRRTLEALRR
jgi:O-antigen/teichoic acid export membrane protein